MTLFPSPLLSFTSPLNVAIPQCQKNQDNEGKLGSLKSCIEIVVWLYHFFEIFLGVGRIGRIPLLYPYDFPTPPKKLFPSPALPDDPKSLPFPINLSWTRGRASPMTDCATQRSRTWIWDITYAALLPGTYIFLLWLSIGDGTLPGSPPFPCAGFRFAHHTRGPRPLVVAVKWGSFLRCVDFRDDKHGSCSSSSPLPLLQFHLGVAALLQRQQHMQRHRAGILER